MTTENANVGQVAKNVNESGSDWWASMWAAEESHEVILKRITAGGDESLGTLFLTAEEFPDWDDVELYVKELHGGGKYSISRRDPETGRFLPGSRRVFRCGGAVKNAEPVQQEKQLSGLEQFAALMIQAQRESENRMMALLEKLGEKPVTPPSDPLDMVEKVAGILAKTGAAPVPQKTLFEQLQEFKAGAELLGMGEKEGEGDLSPLLMELIGGIREAVSESQKTERVKAVAKTQGARRVARNEERGADSAPAANAEKKPVGVMDFFALLDELVKAAASGADAEEVAARVWESAKSDAATVEKLKTLLDRDDALQVLASANSKVRAHFDWFEQLANAVLDFMEAGDGSDQQQPGGGGASAKGQKIETARRGGRSVSNTATHARAGSPRKQSARSAGASVGTGR